MSTPMRIPVSEGLLPWYEYTLITYKEIFQHTNRTIHDFEGNVVKRDNALFVQSLDYRSTADLPPHSFLQGGAAPDCTGIADEYCRLPYYTAIHELFPPE